jgi:hypothetical protein
MSKKVATVQSDCVPLHSCPAGREYGRVCGELLQTQDVSELLVRLRSGWGWQRRL